MAKKTGSQIAKNGFKNESDIVRRLCDVNDDMTLSLLKLLGLADTNNLNVGAVKIGTLGYKTDLIFFINHKNHNISYNISAKLVSNAVGFNQIDKRWVDTYKTLWSIPNDIVQILKLFTGEEKSKNTIILKDPRRMFFNEMSVENQKAVKSFFIRKKDLILRTVLMGPPTGNCVFEPHFVGIVNKKDVEKWNFVTIESALQTISDGEIEITKRGSLKIGNIKMQRKGGDNGEDTANMLQFKFNPMDLAEWPGL